jgi:hypothetical protein
MDHTLQVLGGGAAQEIPRPNFVVKAEPSLGSALTSQSEIYVWDSPTRCDHELRKLLPSQPMIYVWHLHRRHKGEQPELEELVSSIATPLRWRAYLDSLVKPEGPFSSSQLRVIKDFLTSLPPFTLLPSASPTDEGGFMMVWDRDKHHMELEVLEDRTVEWFYWNRLDDSYDGGRGTIDSLGDLALKRFEETIDGASLA